MFPSSAAKQANIAAAITDKAVQDMYVFVMKSLNQTKRKQLMVSVHSTWLVASHRITVAFSGQVSVLHTARKDKHDKVTVIISHGFMRAH